MTLLPEPVEIVRHVTGLDQEFSSMCRPEFEGFLPCGLDDPISPSLCEGFHIEQIVRLAQRCGRRARCFTIRFQLLKSVFVSLANSLVIGLIFGKR